MTLTAWSGVGGPHDLPVPAADTDVAADSPTGVVRGLGGPVPDTNPTGPSSDQPPKTNIAGGDMKGEVKEKD